MAEAATPVFPAPDRFVTIRVYSAISGFTEKAIRRKIEDGVWIEKREWIRAPDGHIFIDREGVQRWLTRGV
ncbi:MAG: excisionase [Acidovorax sp.]